MGYVILGLIAGFLAVIVFRTVTFTPKAQPPVSGREVEFNKDLPDHAPAYADVVRIEPVEETFALSDETHSGRIHQGISISAVSSS